MSKRIGNVDQAAKTIGMSVSWIRQNMDQLPHLKIGRRVVFDLNELGEMVERRFRREPQKPEESDREKVPA